MSGVGPAGLGAGSTTGGGSTESCAGPHGEGRGPPARVATGTGGGAVPTGEHVTSDETAPGCNGDSSRPRAEAAAEGACGRAARELAREEGGDSPRRTDSSKQAHKQATGRPTNQPTKQASNQPINQATTQPNNQPTKIFERFAAKCSKICERFSGSGSGSSRGRGRRKRERQPP